MICSSLKSRTSSGGRPCHGTDGTEPSMEPAELLSCIRALEAEKLRLQVLVCDLLCENELLRPRQT
jgi:hypothetical protein